MSAGVAERIECIVRTLVYSSAFFLGTRVVSSRLHAVAAGLHVAPTPGMVLAHIEEEPAAGWVAAIFDQLRIARDQQVRCGLSQHPQRDLRLPFHARPAPLQVR